MKHVVEMNDVEFAAWRRREFIKSRLMYATWSVGIVLYAAIAKLSASGCAVVVVGTIILVGIADFVHRDFVRGVDMQRISRDAEVAARRPRELAR